MSLNIHLYLQCAGRWNIELGDSTLSVADFDSCSTQVATLLYSPRSRTAVLPLRSASRTTLALPQGKSSGVPCQGASVAMAGSAKEHEENILKKLCQLGVSAVQNRCSVRSV